MKRRNFIQLSALISIGLSMPFGSILESCTHIHGRCMDAVYPFLYMADTTGNEKYLKAAILVMERAENNVSQPDGSWTVIPNPKSRKGIAVFGAIALAEALHYHRNVMDEKTCMEWTERLRGAGEYIYNIFTISFTNINYGATGREARLRGLHLTHSLEADIVRDPGFRRMSEAFSEDTYLTTEMIINAITGLQGDYKGLKSTHIGAVVLVNRTIQGNFILTNRYSI